MHSIILEAIVLIFFHKKTSKTYSKGSIVQNPRILQALAFLTNRNPIKEKQTAVNKKANIIGPRVGVSRKIIFHNFRICMIITGQAESRKKNVLIIF